MKQSPLIDRLEAASGHLEAGQVLHALNTLVSIRDGGHFNADLE